MTDLVRFSRKYIVLIAAGIALLSIPLFFVVEERFSYARIEEFTKRHSIVEDISFSAVENLSIKINETEDPVLYRVYLPGIKSGKRPVRISFSRISFLEIGDQVFRTGDEIGGFASEQEGNPLPFKIYAAKGELLYDGYLEFWFTDTTPVAYLSASENAIDLINATEDVTNKPRIQSEIIIINSEGDIDTIESAKLFRHGNSSFMDYETKPYSLNLDASRSLLGMPAGKKWVLKANGMDNTQLLRNEAAFYVARKMGLYPCSEAKFVNLYINGKYNGLYMLIQRVDAAELMGFSDPGNEWLLEEDQSHSMQEDFFTVDDRDIVIHYPYPVSEEKKEYIKEKYKSAKEAVLNDSDYEKYIDVESFVKMYIIQDFFAQVDIDQSSMFLYLDEDGRFHAGPLWDFDLCCGLTGSRVYHEDLTMRSRYIESKKDAGLFLYDLGRSKRFMDKVREYYINEYENIVVEYMNGDWQEELHTIKKSMEVSLLKTGRADRGKGTCDSPDILADWINGRNEYLSSFYLEDKDYVKITFHFAWGEMKALVEKGKPVGFLPDDSHYGNDDSFWGEISGFSDASGKIVDDTFSTDINTDLYAVYAD